MLYIGTTTTKPQELVVKDIHQERRYCVAEVVGLELNRLGGALVGSAQSCGRYGFETLPHHFAQARPRPRDVLWSSLVAEASALGDLLESAG